MTGSTPQQGFGLLELILALALTSMAALLLTQTMGQLGHYERALNSATNELSKMGLLRHKARHSVLFAAPISAPGGGLEGTSQAVAFHYFSSFPSHLKTSLPSAAFSINNGTSWTFDFSHANAEPQTIYGGKGRASLRYLDSEGTWHNQWPPAKSVDTDSDTDSLNVQYRLPRAIQLQVIGNGQPEPFLTFIVKGSLLAPFSNPDTDG